MSNVQSSQLRSRLARSRIGLPVIRELHPDQLILHASGSGRLTPKYQIGLLVASDRISNRHAKSA
jgi:hypothetical protein